MKYTTTQKIVQTIFEGFEQFFNHFCQVSAEVQSAFIHEDYSQIRHLTNQRHLLYPADQLLTLYEGSLIQQDHWVFIKQEYSLTIQAHPTGEIAETFFNSIYCHLYRYQNLQDTYLFLNKSYYKYYPAKDTRIVPLDSFLEKSSSLVQSQIIQDYGLAIIQLAQHNIFLNNFALHNFGVSQHKKVIYLNYNHVHWFDELAPEYIIEAIGQNLRLVLQKYTWIQNVFSEQYPQILDTSFWLELQKKLQTSESQDVFAYNVKLRFNNKGAYSFQNE